MTPRALLSPCVEGAARPKLLDLFCCAGGAAMGYHQAGFDVVGVDVQPQPNYPFRFVQADALEYLAAHGREYDAIHGSPPCQGYAGTRHIVSCAGREYPLLIAPTIAALRAVGRPWVVENVPGSGLSDLTLCGTMFGLPLRRHRHFAASFLMLSSGECRHGPADLGVYAGKVTRLGTHAAAYVASSGRTHYRPQTATLAEGRVAMGIDWMDRHELSQAIPPAYTRFIGEQLMRVVLADRRTGAAA